jgi:hypothetical protein
MIPPFARDLLTRKSISAPIKQSQITFPLLRMR